MSAVALSHPVAERRPRYDRLVAVELRKMVDTRAGFWLSAGVVAATALVVVIGMLTGPAGIHSLDRTLRFALQPSRFLLPMIGILLVTGEFSQRTAMTTFALVPSRPRVLGAKLGAALVVSVAAVAVCFAFSLIAVAIGGDAGTATWSLNAAMIPQALVFVATAMVTGVAFGAALLLSAPAIVAYLLLPTVWVALAANIHALSGVARWLDQSQTLGPLAQHVLSATEWTHALATLAVWMVLPLVVGGWRLMRRDVG
jgi:ABC-type transport system involved in multi-copper enzyme maturation permease subunit